MTPAQQPHETRPERPGARPPRPSRPPKRHRDPSISKLLGRGLTKRCARCGQRKLFRRWFTMVAKCPRCGLEFDREPGWVLGAMTINTAFTFLAIFATMLTGFVLTYPDIAVAPVAIATVTAGALAAVIGYPFSKTLWIAIDLAMVEDSAPTGPDQPPRKMADPGA
jgi:uncharacterized protein (DUF983 family)